MSITPLDLRDIYEFMQQYYYEYNQNPAGMTIARKLGLTQIQVISRQKKLEKLGLLVYRKGKHPAYTLAEVEEND